MTEQNRMGEEIEGDNLLIVQAARIIQQGIATRHDKDALTVLRARLSLAEEIVTGSAFREQREWGAMFRGACLALVQKWREEARRLPAELPPADETDAYVTTYLACADELEALVKP